MPFNASISFTQTMFQVLADAIQHALMVKSAAHASHASDLCDQAYKSIYVYFCLSLMQGALKFTPQDRGMQIQVEEYRLFKLVPVTDSSSPRLAVGEGEVRKKATSSKLPKTYMRIVKCTHPPKMKTHQAHYLRSDAPPRNTQKIRMTFQIA